jgi:uncharacterized protein YceH (UPF0502 family)
METHMLPLLSLLETRVLGVLAEKERTVPDTYPMTLNALIAGCNQKTSRDPLLNATETEVQAALDSLKGMSLVIESSGGRVARYTHNIERVLQIPRQSTAVLAVLMLRGAQTAGELRINCERLHKFEDISAVEGFLHELASRPAGALVAELPRQAGTRETRWMHLLSGGVPSHVPGDDAPATVIHLETISTGEVAALKANVARLQGEVDELKGIVKKLCTELGIPGPEPATMHTSRPNP